MKHRRLLEKVEKVLERWAEDPYLIATKRDLSLQAYSLTSALWTSDPLPSEEMAALSESFCGLCRAIAHKPCPCTTFEDSDCWLLR